MNDNLKNVMFTWFQAFIRFGMYEYPILMHNLKFSSVSIYITAGFSNSFAQMEVLQNNKDNKICEPSDF